MDFVLNYWGYLAILFVSFTAILLIIVVNHCFRIVSEIFAAKKTNEVIKNEKLYVLKAPIGVIVTLMVLNIIFSLIGVSDIFFKINNTILVIVSALVFLYLLDAFVRIWQRKWEDDELLKCRTESVSNIWRFFWLLAFLVIVVSLALIWRVEFAVFVHFVEYLRVNPYLNALTVFVIFLVISKSVIEIFRTYIRNVVREKQIAYDDMILSTIEFPVSIFIVLVGANLSLRQLGFEDGVLISFVNTLVILIIMYSADIMAGNTIDFWERRVKRTKKGKVDEGIFALARNVSKVLIVIVALLLILVAWDLASQLKGVFLSLSVLGVVLGIALRETFSNIISGISLMLDHTFQSNDLIQLEDSDMGVVKEIGLRSTKVVTFDSELLTIPNSTIANSKVLNYTQPNSQARVCVDIGVEYGSDPEKVEKVLLGVVEGKDYIVHPEKTDVWFREMTDFSMNFRLLFYVKDFMESFKIKSDITKEIYYSLAKNKINVALPKRVIYNENGNPVGRNKKRAAKKSK